ncbi:MAG: SIR2 family protein [Planctomycetota bacterium]|jgi:Tfp pilus assembly protein PilF
MPKTEVDEQTCAEEWTAEGFLDEFMRIHRTMQDRSFTFLLGAGASATSGIPMAGPLARRWVEELYTRHVRDKSEISLEDWATPENVSIPGFRLDNVATFYSDVYDRRFADDPDTGYAYLEDEMGDAEPSIGYSVLAQVLEDTRHKVVITTNFDNLVADALSIYAGTFPLVCGHESLTGFVRPKLRRPLVAKIHRDLLFAPESDTASTRRLDDRWASVLRRLLDEYTPIVVGYGGNDGSLMGFLEALQAGEIRGGVYWCYRMADGIPCSRITNVVAKHKGKLIPIVGFDEFMLQIGERFQYRPLSEEIEHQARTRANRYREQFERFQRSLHRLGTDVETEKAVRSVREALVATVKRETSWWAWELRAQAEKSPDERERIYRRGLEQFPDNHELVGNFAYFMCKGRRQHDEAEQLYRRALELHPADAHNTGNFAHFLCNVSKNYDEAELLYRRAVELDPDRALPIGNLAVFLWHIRSAFDEAEDLFRRSLMLDPNNACIVTSFADFKGEVRGDADEAEQLYRRSLELDSDHAYNVCHYAGFLLAQRRLDQAKDQLARAKKLNLGEVNQPAAEVTFYRSVICRMDSQDDAPGLGRLKFLLRRGFERTYWSFASVLATAKHVLPADDVALYTAVAEAIRDDGKVSALDRFERWTAIEPSPIE